MEKQNYLAIIKTFLIALIFLGIGSYIGVYYIPYSIRYILNFAFFILVLFSVFSGRGGFIRTKFSMYVYAFILGVLTGSTYVYYFVRLGSDVFISSVLGVILVFIIAYIIAKSSSEERIFKMSSIVFGGMFALLILEFINIFFFRFGTYDLILSSLGIIIYSTYAIMIMKSVQTKCRYSPLTEREIVQLSFSIFISFLNLLLDLLRFLSIINIDRD